MKTSTCWSCKGTSSEDDEVCNICDGSGIDHTGTDEIVCPHCGGIHDDSWELHRNSEESNSMDCHHCRTEFGFRANLTVTCTTWKL